MKNISQILPWILVAACIVIIFTFINHKDTGIDYKELIKAKDETIQSVIREREAFREMKDEMILKLQEKDSLLRLKYKTNTVRYERVPVIINNLSDAELRGAVENFR